MTTSVRAKFVVHSITRSCHWDKNKGEIQTIRLHPVTTNSEENKKFYAATPGGHIELACVAEAAQQFELGKEYYVDFSLVPAAS